MDAVESSDAGSNIQSKSPPGIPVDKAWQIQYFNAPHRRRKKSLKTTKHMCEMKLRRQSFHWMENTQRWWNPFTDECAYVVEVNLYDGGSGMK